MANLTIDEYKAISEGVVSALKKAGAISTSGARPPTGPGGSSSSGLPSGNFKKQYGALRDSQNTLLDSMHYASKSNLDLANKLNGLGALTEKVTNNAHLDSMVNSIMGMSKSFADSGNKIAAAFNAEMMKDGEVNLKDLFDRLAPMAAAVKNTTKRFEDAGTSLDDLINSNVSAMTSSDNNYQLLLASAKEFGSNLSDQNKDILKKMEAGTDITGDELRKLSKDVKEAHEATSTFVKKMDENGRKALVKGLAAQGATQAFTSMLNINTLSIGALLAVFGKGLIGAWQQFRAIAAAGMSHHFEEIVASSIKLGISSEKLTEMFKQNSITLLKVGSGDFVERINKAQNGLVELGLGLEEAANAANGFHKNAIAAGVDPKNTNAINKSMEQQTAAFAKLRAVTGVTAEEFNSLNAQILSNTENQILSLRLAPSERAARFNELQSLRQEFTQRGLSAEAAQQMMQAMQSFSKNRLKDRLEGAARMQQLGGMLGMGAEGARAGELMRKRNLSGSEKAELAGISGNLKGALEQFGNQGMGFENAADVMEDNMGNAAKGLLDASVQLKLASDQMIGVSDKDVKDAVTASKLSPQTQALIKAQDIATNALKTPLWLLVGSVGGILALMMKGRMGGIKKLGGAAVDKVKSGFSSIFEMMKNFGMPRLIPSFGKFGSMMGSLGTLLSRLAVPIGVVVSLIMSAYDVFSKFGDSLKFSSLFEIVKSIGALVINGIKMFVVDGIGLIGSSMLSIVESLFGGLWEPLDRMFSTLRSWFGEIGVWIDKLTNSTVGKILGIGRSDEEKAKIAEQTKKANDAADASIKKSTKSTVEQTKALENKVSTEKYLGMSGGFDSVSSASLVNDVQKSKINDALVNGTNDKKSTINKETSGTSPTSNTAATSTETGTVTTTTPTNVTLADVHKVLLELLNETVTGTDEIVDGLVKLKPSGSKFTQPSRTLMVQT